MAAELYDEDTQTNTEVSTEEKTDATETPNADDAKVDEVVDDKKVVEEKPEEISLKAIENTKLSDADVKRIEAFAKDRGLSNEAANELMKKESELVDRYAQDQQSKFEDVQKDWVENIKGDKEFGGERFAETAELSKRAAERFLSKDFRNILEESGWGNHPELVKGFARIGRAMENDTFIHGESDAKSGKSMEEIFYGSSD